MGDYTIGACRLEDLFQLGDLANRVFRANRAGDMVGEYPLVFEGQNVENLRVARQGGQLVAHVGICVRDASLLGARIRVASIGAVATDPEHRGHGLATELMRDACRHAAGRGASLMLISGGRGLYHRLGYVEVGLFQQYVVPAGAGEGGFQVSEFQEDDLPAIIRLYQAEPVRFFRPVSDWNKLVAASMLMNQPADLLVIRHANAIVGYAGVQRPFRSGGTLPPARVREYGGSRSALAAALPEIARRYGVEAADVVTWPSDAEWRAQASLRGWRWTPTPFPGTLGIIDPSRFLRAIRPLVQELSGDSLQVEPDGDGARLAAGGEEARLATMGELTALVFGGETDEAQALPDLPPAVRAAVDEVFPLPLLWYGYNYV